MNLARLRTFLRVASCGSFSAAGRELGLSQPAVSHQIKALEDELGARLLDRGPDEICLTPVGREAYRLGHHVLAAAEALERAVRAAGQGEGGRLLIGASTTPSCYLLPPVVAAFREAAPGVEVALHVADSDEIVSRVAANALDLGVVGGRPQRDDLEAFPCGRDRIVLIAPCQGPCGRPPASVKPADLLGQRFVVRESGSGTRRAVEEALVGWGVDPGRLAVGLQVSTTEAVVGAVEAGAGWAFVSELAAERALAMGRICAVPVEAPCITRQMYLIERRERAADPLVARFVEFCRQRGMIPAASGGDDEARA